MDLESADESPHYKTSAVRFRGLTLLSRVLIPAVNCWATTNRPLRGLTHCYRSRLCSGTSATRATKINPRRNGPATPTIREWYQSDIHSRLTIYHSRPVVRLCRPMCGRPLAFRQNCAGARTSFSALSARGSPDREGGLRVVSAACGRARMTARGIAR